MQAVVYGAVGHLSPAERPQYAAHLDPGGLSALSEGMQAWSRTPNLDRDAFRDKYLGGVGSDEVVDYLRNAAEGAAKATTSQQQHDAAGELAAAYRLVGAGRWPRLIADAQDRAAAAAARSDGRVLLAQASTPNTATDASIDALLVHPAVVQACAALKGTPASVTVTAPTAPATPPAEPVS